MDAKVGNDDPNYIAKEMQGKIKGRRDDEGDIPDCGKLD